MASDTQHLPATPVSYPIVPVPARELPGLPPLATLAHHVWGQAVRVPSGFSPQDFSPQGSLAIENRTNARSMVRKVAADYDD
jgi:hypothetical protein